MTQLNAFVGHSFVSEDHEVVDAFLKFFNLVKGMNIGFSWESAEPAAPKELADKVMGLIQDKNLFIGICTTKEAVIEPAYLSKCIFKKNILKGNETHFSSKTSDWIIQEIGLAVGRGMDLILLVEKGLRQPGGLQGNLEYIPFERRTPEKCFGKLLEMIQALLPKAKSLVEPQATIPATTDEMSQEVKPEGTQLLEPRVDWTGKDFDRELFRAILMKDADREKRITAAYLATEDGQVSTNRERWMAHQEELRLVFGEGGTLSKLRDLAAQYPDNADVQRSLAVGYRHYEDHEKAAQCFVQAGEMTSDQSRRLLMFRNAMVEFVHANQKEAANDVLTKMKNLAPEIADGEAVLINGLRQLKDVESDNDLFCGLTERLLQLHPDDVRSRFTLAYNYSRANQAELSLCHYLKIPHPERTAIAWNNLGVQFDHFDLPGKSVDAYRTADNLGETLAMSNLAKKLVKAGFLKEAHDVCNRALQIENYHKNVGSTIQQIKSVPEEEEKKQEELLARATPLSEFYRNFGRAAVRSEILEHAGRWRGPDCELAIEINGSVFEAFGDYEVRESGLRLSQALAGIPEASPKMTRYRVEYTGKMCGHAVNASVSRQELPKSAFAQTLLGEMINRKKALMIISETFREIRVYEKDSSNKASFYSLTKID